MATRSASFDLEVKWRHYRRKQVNIAYWLFSSNVLRKPCWTVVIYFVEWNFSKQNAFLRSVVILPATVTVELQVAIAGVALILPKFFLILVSMVQASFLYAF